MSESEVPNFQKKSDLSMRVKTGLPLAIIVVGIMAFGPTSLVGGVVLVFAVIGALEFYNMFAKNELFVSLPMMLGSAGLMGVASIAGGAVGLAGALLATCIVLIFYYLLFTSAQTISSLQVLGVSLFGVVWIAWSFNHLTLIKGLPEGTALLFFVVLCIWISDVAAYFGGKSFGRNPLAPTISPKKTIEGSVCGVLGSGVFAAIYSVFFVDSLSWSLGLGMGMVVAIVGQMGDLVESKIKRLCEVKDSGTLIPGHGGVLDRVDGFLTAAPVFYYCMYWLS